MTSIDWEKRVRELIILENTTRSGGGAERQWDAVLPALADIARRALAWTPDGQAQAPDQR